MAIVSPEVVADAIARWRERQNPTYDFQEQLDRAWAEWYQNQIDYLCYRIELGRQRREFENGYQEAEA